MSYIWYISTVLLHFKYFLTDLHYIYNLLDLLFKVFTGGFLEKEGIFYPWSAVRFLDFFSSVLRYSLLTTSTYGVDRSF